MEARSPLRIYAVEKPLHEPTCSLSGIGRMGVGARCRDRNEELGQPIYRLGKDLTPPDRLHQDGAEGLEQVLPVCIEDCLPTIRAGHPLSIVEDLAHIQAGLKNREAEGGELEHRALPRKMRLRTRIQVSKRLFGPSHVETLLIPEMMIEGGGLHFGGREDLANAHFSVRRVPEQGAARLNKAIFTVRYRPCSNHYTTVCGTSGRFAPA